MAEEFDDHQKAKDRAEERKLEYTGKICPLLVGLCDPHCVCYQPARVGGNEGGGYNPQPSTKWYVYDPYCSNEMFFKEEINVNIQSNCS